MSDSAAVSDIGPFAMVPEWLLRARVSDRAVRLFAELSRYADRSLCAFPARSTLAASLATSVDSVDRAMKELVAVRAVRVESRTDDAGDRTSNLYRLTYANPDAGVGVAAPMRPPSRTPAATGSRTHAATVAAPVRHRTITTGTKDDHSIVDAAFDDQFWPHYPRHVAKKAAKKAFARINPDEHQVGLMVAALERQKATQWRGNIAQGGDALRFIPHPATWLNEERWLDEVPSTASTGSFDSQEQDTEAFIARRRAKQARLQVSA